MIGICVLTVGIVLSSLGITNAIYGLQNVILVKELKKDIDDMKREKRCR
jgi:hypothetical protein